MKKVKLYGKNPQKFIRTHKKMDSLIEKYNQKARKWHFSELTFDESKLLPSFFGILDSQSEPTNFWQFLLYIFRYDYMKHEWQRIYNQSKKLRQMRFYE